MEREQVRRVMIEVDASLLQQFFTTGWESDGTKCVSGLPPTARYVEMFMSRYRPSVCLVFEDDSFGLVPREIEPPWLSVTFKKTSNEPV